MRLELRQAEEGTKTGRAHTCGAGLPASFHERLELRIVLRTDFGCTAFARKEGLPECRFSGCACETNQESLGVRYAVNVPRDAAG